MRAEFLFIQFVYKRIPDDQWIEYVKEITDFEVVIGLIEHRLGWKRGSVNKDIWKFYFDFVRDKNDTVQF